MPGMLNLSASGLVKACTVAHLGHLSRAFTSMTDATVQETGHGDPRDAAAGAVAAKPALSQSTIARAAPGSYLPPSSANAAARFGKAMKWWSMPGRIT